MVDSSLEDQKIRTWQKDVVSSIADDASTIAHNPPPTLPSTPSPVVVNQIVTSPPVVVTRVRAPESKTPDEISTKAIIGTVVGATAGAFIAYAMVKGDSENYQQPRSQERITYRTIEVPVGYDVGGTRPITRVPIQDACSNLRSFAARDPEARALTIGPPLARAETLVPSSVHSHYSARSDPRSHRPVSQRGPILMVDNDTRSRASSGRNAVKQQGVTVLPPSAPVTEVRMARDVPLPARSQESRYSRATSVTVKDKAPSKAAVDQSRVSHLPSVAPDDSISQVSTNISRDSGRSKHRRSSHHSRHKGGSKSGRDIEAGRASKAGSKRHSRMGDVVDDVVSRIKGASIKDGDYRSRH